MVLHQLDVVPLLNVPVTIGVRSRHPTVVHMDSLESQMAALHGAAGANTPWQEFNENYFGH